MSRSENDLQGIRRYEGEEAYQRALVEEGRAPPPSSPHGGAFSVLLEIAKALGVPKDAQKRLDDLVAQTKTLEASRAVLVKERRDFERAQDRAHEEHSSKIATELKQHNDAIEAARAEIEAARAEIEALRNQAHADAAKAAALKETWQKKLSAFEAA